MELEQELAWLLVLEWGMELEEVPACWLGMGWVQEWVWQALRMEWEQVRMGLVQVLTWL